MTLVLLNWIQLSYLPLYQANQCRTIKGIWDFSQKRKSSSLSPTFTSSSEEYTIGLFGSHPVLSPKAISSKATDSFSNYKSTIF